MQRTHLGIGTKVVIQTEEGDEPTLGKIVDGPLFISSDAFFKIEANGHVTWHPAEHLGPYLRVVDD